MSGNPCQADGVAAAADVTFVTGELRPYLADLLDREQAAWKERGAPWLDPLEALAAYARRRQGATAAVLLLGPRA